MLLSNRTVGGSHHRLRDAANILEEEEEDISQILNKHLGQKCGQKA